MSNDDALMTDLAAMWTRRDPMPAGMVERMIAAVAAEDLDREYELLGLVERTQEIAGARSAGLDQTITRLEFRRGEVVVMLLVRPGADGLRRIDGWVAPPEGVTVSLVSLASDSELTAVVEAGRFAFDGVQPGLVRLWLTHDVPPDGSDPLASLFATPTFEI